MLVLPLSNNCNDANISLSTHQGGGGGGGGGGGDLSRMALAFEFDNSVAVM